MLTICLQQKDVVQAPTTGKQPVNRKKWRGRVDFDLKWYILGLYKLNNMKIEAKYAGKWVAIRNEKVVASENTLAGLDKKVEKMRNQKNLSYTLLPKGLFAGAL